MLALHLLQSALVYVNTLLLQTVLADQPGRSADRRRTGARCPRSSGRTCGPYGTFSLDLDRAPRLSTRTPSAHDSPA